MSGKTLCFALGCVFALSVSVVATLAAQGRGKAQKPVPGAASKARKTPVLPEMKNGSMPVLPRVMARRLGENPAFDVAVDPDLDLTPAESALYQDMANHLSGHTDVPAARTGFYSGVGGYEFVKWSGLVTNVTPIVGGYSVTATVSPALTLEGSPALVDGTYIETFNVINGTVTYAGSQDPNGEAGQSLTVVLP